MALPENVIVKWSNPDEGIQNAVLLVWGIRKEARLEDELKNLSNGFQEEVFASEPVPKLALLGTSVLVSLVLMQTATSSSTLCNLMGLKEDTISEHLAVSLSYRWCIEPGFQRFEPSWYICVFAKPSESDGRGWNITKNFYVIVFEKRMSRKMMLSIAKQTSETQHRPHCVFFMSLPAYLVADSVADPDLTNSAWYEFAEYQLDNPTPSQISTCWVWNPHKDQLIELHDLSKALAYVRLTDFQ